MMGSQELYEHLRTGATHVARCWALRRKDGVGFGFTDHDQPLTFDGLTFEANGGLTASNLQQSTGLSVDNTEAMGALSSVAVTEADILAGRFDGALIESWLVNWDDVDVRVLQFSGSLGELQRQGGAFQAELRGLAQVLNQPKGRIYQRPCTAILGDKKCGFDTEIPGYFADLTVGGDMGSVDFTFPGLSEFEDRWFERGRLIVQTGQAAGLEGLIKKDRLVGQNRVISLWQELRAPLQEGDEIKLISGCDKSTGTCRLKFDNFLNYQGFPHIPGEDWLMAYPKSSDPNEGSSLFDGDA